MALTMLADTTEWLFIAIVGDLPSQGGQVAFLPAGQRPDETDWTTTEVVSPGHSLWGDAQGSGLAGDYYLAVLVGDWTSDGGGLAPHQVTLPVGDWQVWIRLTDVVERPVRIAPVAVEVVEVP